MLDVNIDNNVNMLRDSDVDIHRKSMDKKKNNFGNRLLELCRCNNLFICNGRVGNDKGIGKFTSKNSNVVDYAICFLGFVQDF